MTTAALIHTTPDPRRLPILSTTGVRRFRACPRDYYYAQELRIEPAYVDDNRREGTLGHLGLEAWWRAVADRSAARAAADSTVLTADLSVHPGPPTAVEWMAPVQASFEAIRATDANLYELARMEALLYGYHARWASAGLEPVLVPGADDLPSPAVEVEFETDLVNPLTGGVSRTFRKGGRLDALVRDVTDGRVYVLEHKFTSEDFSAGSDYEARLTLNSQISTYMDGARALGFEPAGCIYDVIGKPAHRPLRATPEEKRRYGKRSGLLDKRQRTDDETPDTYRNRIVESIAENPEKYYRRMTVVRLEREQVAAGVNFARAAQEIIETRQAARRLGELAWSQNDAACLRYGRSCDYLAICTGQSSVTDRTRYKRKEDRK